MEALKITFESTSKFEGNIGNFNLIFLFTGLALIRSVLPKSWTCTCQVCPRKCVYIMEATKNKLLHLTPYFKAIILMLFSSVLPKSQCDDCLGLSFLTYACQVCLAKIPA